MENFRIQKNRDFTVMSNYHLRDRNLSYKAKGLLSFMLSLPDDWDYSLKGLVAISKESHDAIKTAIDELKQNGYLKIDKVRTKSGKFSYDYYVYEIPTFNREISEKKPEGDFPYLDNPEVEEPALENPTQINTNNKDNIDNIDKTSEPIPNNEEFNEDRKHHKLTKELIKTKYIGKEDVEADCFDEIFRNYLSSGITYPELMGSIHYIAPRVVKRKFLDSRGRPIENKITYFKNSFEENRESFKNIPDEIYPEFDELER